MPEPDKAGKVVAIDPGREKCGVAVVSSEREVILKAIVPAGRLLDEVQDLVARHGASTIVVGDRTGSRELARAICERLYPGDAIRPGAPDRGASGDARDAGARREGRDIEIMLVDEHESSMEARRRYLLEHPGRGLERLLPVSMRVPREPYDDYVAVILAERYFGQARRAGPGRPGPGSGTAPGGVNQED